MKSRFENQICQSLSKFEVENKRLSTIEWGSGVRFPASPFYFTLGF